MKRAQRWTTYFFAAVSAAGPAISEDISPARNDAGVVTHLTPDAVMVVPSGQRLGNTMISLQRSDKTEPISVYYPPSLIPEWADYRSRVYKACTDVMVDASDGAADEPASLDPLVVDPFAPAINIPLLIFVDDKFYREEMEKALPGLSKHGVSENAILRPMPFSRMIVQLNIPGLPTGQILYDSSSRGEVEKLENPEYMEVYPRDLVSNVTARCEDHFAVIDAVTEGKESIVRGIIYTPGTRYDETLVTGTIASTFDRTSQTDILSEETVHNEAVADYSGSAKGLSGGGNGPEAPGMKLIMNLIGGGGGESGAHSRISSETSRIVNRNFIEKVIQSNLTQVDISCRSRSQNCTEKSSRLFEFLTSKDKEITLTFDKNADNSFKLMNGQVEYVTLSPSQSEALLEAAPDFSLNETDNKAVTLGAGAAAGTGASASATHNTSTDTKVKDDISWKLVGNAPVPTSAKLYVLNQLDIENGLNLVWAEVTPINSEVVSREMVYPSKGYRHLSVDIAEALAAGNSEADRVLPYAEYEAREDLKNRCHKMAMDKAIDSSNLTLGKGDRIVDANARVVRHSAHGTQCKAAVNVTWTASPGYFFLIGPTAPAMVVFQESGPRHQLVQAISHPADVMLDGNWNHKQAATRITVDASTSRGHSWDNSSCWATAELVAKHVSEQCIPFLLEDLSQ